MRRFGPGGDGCEGGRAALGIGDIVRVLEAWEVAS
jgi:hypothetical protein